MDQTEHVCAGTVLVQSLDDGIVGIEVALDFAGFNVEYIDEDGNVGEYVTSLAAEVGLHEGILSGGVSSAEVIKKKNIYTLHNPKDLRSNSP